ncbi:minor capsid protein [Salmonella enterica]|nr:minor capsid protein [Salmonella enterica]EJT0199972.1 minor capsid protein [Salmonella enterica]
MSIIESFISHQVWLQRNASHEVNELSPFIQQMRDEVRKQVLQFGDDNRTRKNLEKLLRDLEDILDGITTDWQDKLTEDLQTLAGYEADWATKTLTANVDAEFVTPSPEQVWSAAKWNPLALNDKPADLFGMMAGWGDTEINRLVTGVKMGFVQGKTTRQIVKEVVGTGGLADISQRNAATVIRTALNHVSTQARETTYKKNSDIVEKYEWVSTLDSRTSTICRSRDGQKYEIGKGPLPPAHPNCRSTTVPVISSEFDFLDKGAKRAAKGAEGGQQVDASTTYYDFLKQQPAWFIDKALGPVRGAIFRNAGMTPEEFRVASVNGFGIPMTLKEMAEADKKVADYLASMK